MWFPIWRVNNEMYCRHRSTGFPAGWPHLLPLWYCSTNLPLDNRKAFPVTRKSVVSIVKTSIDGYEWWTSMHSKWRAVLQSGKWVAGTFQLTLCRSGTSAVGRAFTKNSVKNGSTQTPIWYLSWVSHVSLSRLMKRKHVTWLWLKFSAHSHLILVQVQPQKHNRNQNLCH